MDREAIINRLKETPEQTTKQIAEELGIRYSAACKLRHELEVAGIIPKMARGWGRNRQKAAMDTTSEVTEEAEVLDLSSDGDEREAEDLEVVEEEDTFEPAPLTDEEKWNALKAAVLGMADIFAGAGPSLWANKEARKQYLAMWDTWDKVVWAMCRFDDPKAVHRKFDVFADELDGEDGEDDEAEEDDWLL